MCVIENFNINGSHQLTLGRRAELNEIPQRSTRAPFQVIISLGYLQKEMTTRGVIMYHNQPCGLCIGWIDYVCSTQSLIHSTVMPKDGLTNSSSTKILRVHQIPWNTLESLRKDLVNTVEKAVFRALLYIIKKISVVK
ncbi:hypothetical protein CEXT_185421 [Caerostris extrusa]|uniref:Uncharacterized protein n=1 Tax=Caerostris extrusa TaxID=172846 RepID=A0AAV4S0I4_CAEEX|nr:hypothetical protein CEXT_185421 [Caerostris extrusa]